ncbi:MAG: hypothetical protein IJ244_05750 [Bacteroidaceae bacterium]|nr:hypothetical protein [Bacteroidaceae bacterium]
MKLRLLLILTIGLFSMEGMAKTGWKRSDLLRQIYHHPDTAAVMVLAHRGDHLHAPENSLLSLRNCIRMGWT